jgi:hypothetical protein
MPETSLGLVQLLLPWCTDALDSVELRSSAFFMIGNERICSSSAKRKYDLRNCV